MKSPPGTAAAATSMNLDTVMTRVLTDDGRTQFAPDASGFVKYLMRPGAPSLAELIDCREDPREWDDKTVAQILFLASRSDECNLAMVDAGFAPLLIDAISDLPVDAVHVNAPVALFNIVMSVGRANDSRRMALLCAAGLPALAVRLAHCGPVRFHGHAARAIHLVTHADLRCALDAGCLGAAVHVAEVAEAGGTLERLEGPVARVIYAVAREDVDVTVSAGAVGVLLAMMNGSSDAGTLRYAVASMLRVQTAYPALVHHATRGNAALVRAFAVLSRAGAREPANAAWDLLLRNLRHGGGAATRAVAQAEAERLVARYIKGYANC